MGEGSFETEKGGREKKGKGERHRGEIFETDRGRSLKRGE